MVRVTALCCALTLPAAVLAPSLATLAFAMLAMGASFAMMDVAVNASAVEMETPMGRAILSAIHPNLVPPPPFRRDEDPR